MIVASNGLYAIGLYLTLNLNSEMHFIVFNHVQLNGYLCNSIIIIYYFETLTLIDNNTKTNMHWLTIKDKHLLTNSELIAIQL